MELCGVWCEFICRFVKASQTGYVPKRTGFQTPTLKQNKKTWPPLHQIRLENEQGCVFMWTFLERKILLYAADYTRMWSDAVPKHFIHNNQQVENSLFKLNKTCTLVFFPTQRSTKVDVEIQASLHTESEPESVFYTAMCWPLSVRLLLNWWGRGRYRASKITSGLETNPAASVRLLFFFRNAYN